MAPPKPMQSVKSMKSSEPRRGRARNTDVSKSAAQYNAISAKKNVDELRKRFNDELLKILEEEQRKENLREETLRNILDVEEAMRMEKKFGIERAKASQRILDVSGEHEQIILKEMKRLGIV